MSSSSSCWHSSLPHVTVHSKSFTTDVVLYQSLCTWQLQSYRAQCDPRTSQFKSTGNRYSHRSDSHPRGESSVHGASKEWYGEREVVFPNLCISFVGKVCLECMRYFSIDNLHSQNPSKILNSNYLGVLDPHWGRWSYIGISLLFPLNIESLGTMRWAKNITADYWA